MKFVQFKDSEEKELIAVFSSEQLSESYTNLGEVDETDERYIDFVKKLL